jgi:hypothetical protein
VHRREPPEGEEDAFELTPEEAEEGPEPLAAAEADAEVLGGAAWSPLFSSAGEHTKYQAAGEGGEGGGEGRVQQTAGGPLWPRVVLHRTSGRKCLAAGAALATWIGERRPGTAPPPLQTPILPRITGLRSNQWPGAFCVCKGGHFANVYVGWGVKTGAFIPQPPPPVRRPAAVLLGPRVWRRGSFLTLGSWAG